MTWSLRKHSLLDRLQSIEGDTTYRLGVDDHPAYEYDCEAVTEARQDASELGRTVPLVLRHTD
jgi:hypothetical protein